MLKDGKKIVASFVFLFLCVLSSAANAGPNADAGCAVDLDIGTLIYADSVSRSGIEWKAQLDEGVEFYFIVVAQNVSNLDTYNFDVDFDSQILSFVDGYGGIPAAGIVNILETNGGSAPDCFFSEVSAGKVNVANALAYSSKEEAPEGSGVAAVLKFQVLQAGEPACISLSNVVFIDTDGSLSVPQESDSVVHLNSGYVNYTTVYVVEDIGDCPAGQACYDGFQEAFASASPRGVVDILPGTGGEAVVLDMDNSLTLGPGAKAIIDRGEVVLE